MMMVYTLLMESKTHSGDSSNSTPSSKDCTLVTDTFYRNLKQFNDNFSKESKSLVNLLKS
jgi:hypothetical protein